MSGPDAAEADAGASEEPGVEEQVDLAAGAADPIAPQRVGDAAHYDQVGRIKALEAHVLSLQQAHDQLYQSYTTTCSIVSHMDSQLTEVTNKLNMLAASQGGLK